MFVSINCNLVVFMLLVIRLPCQCLLLLLTQNSRFSLVVRWKRTSVRQESRGQAPSGQQPVYADLATIYETSVSRPPKPHEHYKVPTKQPPPLPPPRKTDEVCQGYMPMKPITVHSMIQTPKTSDGKCNVGTSG